MNLLRKPAFQLSKHLLILGLAACLSSPAWAASGAIRSLSLDPATHRLSVDSSGPVRAVVNTLNISGRKRVIIDIEDAAIGFELPRDSELLARLSAQWGAIKNVSVNQFDGHNRSIVRILIDVDADFPNARLIQAQGSQLELQLGNPPAVAQAPARPAYRESQPQPFPAYESVPARPATPVPQRPVETPPAPSAYQSAPVVQQPPRQPESTVSEADYRRALQALEDQKKMVMGMQQQMTELSRSQSEELQRLRADNTALRTQQNEEIQKLRADNAALQNRLNLTVSTPAVTPHQQAELNSLRKAVTDADTRLNALMRENQDLKSQLSAGSANSQELSAQQSEIDRLRKMNQSLQDQLALAMKPVQTQSASTIELDGLKQTLVNMNHKYDALLQDNHTLRAKLDSLQQRDNLASSSQQAELERLKGANQSLQDQLNLAYQERNSLKDQLASTQTSGNRLAALESQLNGAKSELSELRAENARLMSQAKAATPATDATGLTSELNRYKEKSELLQGQLAEMQLENNRLRAQANRPAAPQSGNAELADLRTQMEMAQESLGTSIQTINEQNKEIAYLRNQINSLQQGFDNTAKDQILTLRQDLGAKEDEIRQLRAELAAGKTSPAPAVPDSTLKKQLDKLTEQYKTTVDDLTRQRMDQEQQLLAYKSRAKEAEALKGEVADLKKELAAVQNRKTTEANQEAAGLRQELASAKAELEALRDNVTSLQGENEKLAARVSQQPDPSVKQELASTRQENQDLKATMVKMDAEIKALAAEKSQLQELREQVTVLEHELVEAGKQLKAAQNGDGKLEQQVSLLEQQLTQANKERQDALADANKHRQQVATLQDELTQAKAATGDAKAAEKQLAQLRSQVASLEADLKKARSKSPKSPEAPVDDRKVADLQAQVEDMNRQITELHKENADLKTQLTDASKGQPVKAAPTVSQGASLADAERHYHKAKSLLEGGDVKKAIEQYREALRYDPSNSQYVYEYSIALAEERQYSSAIDVLTKHLQRNPGDRLAYHQLGKIYLLNDQVDAANQALSRALPVSTLNNYATSLKKLNRLEEAEAVYKLALSLSPSDTEVLFNLGTLYNAANKLTEAKSTYQEALRLKPDFAEAHYNLGLIYSKLGDKTAAIDHLEKFLQLSPDARNADTIRSYVQKLKA